MRLKQANSLKSEVSQTGLTRSEPVSPLGLSLDWGLLDTLCLRLVQVAALLAACLTTFAERTVRVKRR